MGLWHTDRSSYLGQKTRPYNNQLKRRTCKIVDFAVPADHRIKLKKCEKKDMYLDLARELKKLWNTQVKIILIVIGAFGTVTKGLQKGLEDLEVGGRVKDNTIRVFSKPLILNKNPHDWVRKLILQELCKKLKFDQVPK